MNRPCVPVVLGLALTLAVAAPPARAEDGPRVWSVVVGINKYEDTMIPPCSGSIRDARSASDWLADVAGWGEAGVLRMDDFGKRGHGPAAARSPDLLPTRENLDWAVTGWLAERVRPDDLVVIYFAGQAASRPPRPGASSGRAYLLPIDARGADVDATGWSLDDALDRAGTARKARVVVWLDTSARGRGGRGMAREVGAPSGDEWLRALTRWPGVTAWLAADGRPAPEDGAFVAAIRRGMGGADRPHNLMGCLAALRDERALADRGFRAMGGVDPSASLWSGGARPVEQAVPELVVQAGHGAGVTSVLLAADNARAITASEDSTVRVWKFGDGEPAMVRVLTEPFIGVKALALDRDGRLLIAGDGAGGIVGWDMVGDRAKSIYGPPGHEDPIVALAFLPEGLSFVSLDATGRSILWDGSGGAIRKVRSFSGRPITRLAASPRPAPGAPALVAATEDDRGVGSLLGFDARGSEVAPIEGPGGRITALDLSSDGRRLAVGDDRGRLMVRDLPGPAVPLDRAYRGPIRTARLARTGALVVADDRSLRLVDPKGVGPDVELVDARGRPAPGRVARAEFSDDGRWLAACSAIEGRVFLWDLADPARPAAVAIPDHKAPGLSPAFTPDGRTLVLGDQDGGIRIWGLEGGPGGPRALPRAGIPAARGRVAALSPSPSGRFLLEITKDDIALVWDLEQGRGCRPLPGLWSSGVFLPDESRLLLLRKPDLGPGGPVLFDREQLVELPTAFARPLDPDGKPLGVAFGRVVVSKSGRWAAAASIEAQLPMACVWEVATGRLAHSARGHEAGLTAVDFSADEESLLTASADGTAKLWPLADPSPEIRRASVAFFNPDNLASAFTAARASPADPRRVATGSIGGLVMLWDWDKARGKTTRVGEPIRLNGAVNALAFSPDGRWLAASSSTDKSIRFIDLSGGLPRSVAFAPRVHHDEQVGALAAWPGGAMIVSGGDDAAVRFWDLKGRALVGTLIAQARDRSPVDWLAYTPEGLFDGSMPGESMVKWRVGDRLVTLQQAEDTHYSFRVAAAIARGEKPSPESTAPPRADGPGLKLFAPPPWRAEGPREVEIRLWSDTPRPASLRLYQNGVPIRGELDFDPGETDHFVRTRVQLRPGENRLYAMASKPGAADGRSEEVVLRYDGPEPAGRLHTLALGISDYGKRPLKYAHLDAEEVARVLGRRGVRGGQVPGEQIVLVNDQVNADAIEDAFRRLRAAVKGRPEDTVVLFLAGHTDTDDLANQFCLLLPRFPFEGAPPRVGDLAARGVARRGAGGADAVRARVGSPDVLPYVFLYNRLARLEALQRMVIVDACQAGAILDDVGVRRIQRDVEVGSRKARNSYLLAARRGEPANEADALSHGLLTYTLLRGMGAGPLKPIPEGLGGFPGPPTADLDADGLVTSDELVAFADQALPRLARIFPDVVVRAGGAIPPQAAGEPPPAWEVHLRLQSQKASFPLVILPNP